MTEPTASPPPVKDFSRPHRQLQFRIDDDLFEAARALPGKTLARFAARFSDIDEKTPVDKQLDVFTEALGMVLLPESNACFQKRLDDLEKPIELEQASDVITWLLEEYGLRPTEPSSESSSGLPGPASGTNSTGEQQPQALIPATFQPTAS
ncbi:hypothetical protein AB0J81_09060 [Streptomyces bobili]|uniref:hypothetical protein n=1 Tax=Streptomyces bobili TaxID=67280 RepID=UPI00341CDB23